MPLQLHIGYSHLSNSVAAVRRACLCLLSSTQPNPQPNPSMFISAPIVRTMFIEGLLHRVLESILVATAQSISLFARRGNDTIAPLTRTAKDRSAKSSVKTVTLLIYSKEASAQYGVRQAKLGKG